MGYKLAGYDVVGCCEIDPRQVALYSKNLHPRFVFQDDIRKLGADGEIPDELRDLDILDGSPPCTLFSQPNYRNMNKRGKSKKFREGQAEQILDDLFFWFLDLAERLRPKVIVAENVSGMLVTGKDYIRRIIARAADAGYLMSIHDLNGADMGIPQARLRVFFVAVRADLVKSSGIGVNGFVDPVPVIDMNFTERHISFKSASERAVALPMDPLLGYTGKINTGPKHIMANWKYLKPGESFGQLYDNGNNFSYFKLHPNLPTRTLVASFYFTLLHYAECRILTPLEYALCSSFPLDYDYMGEIPYYVMGMSVPPVMMAQVADRVHAQWLDKINAGRRTR